MCTLGSLILILHQSTTASRALYASALKGIVWYRAMDTSGEGVVSVILSGMVGLARLLVIFIGCDVMRVISMLYKSVERVEGFCSTSTLVPFIFPALCALSYSP